MAELTSETKPATFTRLNDLLIAPQCVDAFRGAGLDSLDGLFAMEEADSLGKPGLPSWRQRLRFELEVGGQKRTFYLKRFVNPPASARREVRRAGCGATSTAGVEWTWINRLAADGIAVAEPIAFGEAHTGRRERLSAIVTAGAAGDSLETWATRWQANGNAPLRQLSLPLAQLIARLHDKGYFHRDLYLCHVFYDPEAAIEEALRLIDLQRVIRPTCLRRRWLVKDLAALNYSTPPAVATRTDRLRWLKQYLGVSKLDPPARRLAYRVAGKTRRIARHDRKRTVKHRAQGKQRETAHK